VQTLAGVEPDLTCLGKIIGGSLPCGAVVGRRDIMDAARSTRDPFRDVESKAFVSGTMSGNSLACAAGVAVLTYLKEHPEIYVRLEEQTRWLRETMVAIAARRGVPFRMKGARSIFSLSFDHRSPKLYREKVTGGNFKANLALSYYMRRQGVYVPELHTMMLNAMHTQADLEAVAAAFDHSLGEMVADGFFVL
jgi:glutamate-1-semialdehyde 2,1-aminomutase